MAKKKVSHPSQTTHDLKSVTPMDDPTLHNHQIQNLKNLNSVLLKETTERRNQIGSLLHEKDILLSNTMAAESRFSDATLTFDIQNAVLFAFVKNQVKEMRFLFGERDYEVAELKREVIELTTRLESQKVKFDAVREEREQVKTELVARLNLLEESENREKKIREEAEKLRLEGDKLLEEGSEKERAIAELKHDRDLAVRNSEENAKVIDELKEEIHGVSREKNEIQKVKESHEVKITNLENELKQLDELLNNSRNEEALMRSKILQLEESLGLVVEKEEQKEMEISNLLKEKKEVEKNLDDVNKVLDAVEKELESKKHELDETIRARDELLQVKVNRGNEIVELQGEIDLLRDLVENLKVSCRESQEENKQLVSQVNSYKNALDKVVLEKEKFTKRFDEEKNKVKNLELQLAAMERNNEQKSAELGQMRSERDELLEKIVMLENQANDMMKAKNALQNSLVEAKVECDDLRAKIEFSSINSEKALAMLKSTAEFLSQYKESAEEVVFNGRKLEEETEPYAKELDAIRKAFKSKNKMVDDMNQQLVSLQKSVNEAHKSKNLWTAISSALSATTIFAAFFAAYAARGR